MRPLFLSVWLFSSHITSGATRPWRISDRLNAFSASNRVRPAAASSTVPSSSPPRRLCARGGKRPGNLLELIAASQIVLDDDELTIELNRDLNHRRQDDDEGPVLLSHRDRRVQRLHDLGATKEAVEVPQDQQG